MRCLRTRPEPDNAELSAGDATGYLLPSVMAYGAGLLTTFGALALQARASSHNSNFIALGLPCGKRHP